MSFLPLIPLAAWTMLVFVWSFVFGRYRHGHANKAFLSFAACACMWVTVELLFYLPAFDGLEMVLLRIVILFWLPVGYLFLAFAYALTDRRPDAVYLLSALATTACIAVDIGTDVALKGATRHAWGVADVRGVVAHTLLCAVPVSSSLWGLWLILRKRLAAQDREERKTLDLILIGGLLSLGGVLLMSILLPNFLGAIDLPRFGSSAMAVFVLVVFLAVLRRNFLTLSVERVADDLFEDVRDGIAIVDREGHVRRMNRTARELTGWGGGETRPGHASHLLGGYDPGDGRQGQEVRIGTGERERIVSVSRSVVSGSGSFDGRILLLRDVTDQLRAKEILERSRDQLEEEVHRRTMELRQAQRMEAMGTLAGGIAHDFNNLLAAIIGFSTVAVDETPAGHPARADFQEVLKAAHQAKDIVRQLLGFSRLEKPRREIVDVREVLEEVAALLEASVPASIAIVRDFSGARGAVLADHSSLHQVLMNLGTNAFQAIGSQRGRIRLGFGVEDLDAEFTGRHGLPWPGPYVHVEVEDSGQGIEAAAMRLIFEPFYTTREPGKGTGLGLATARRIVDDHDGAITIDSEVGRGSRFHVYLPYVSEDQADANLSGEGMDLRGTERVMLVDHQDEILRIGKRLLEPLGYRVDVFRDPERALEALALDPAGFDAVVCDQRMDRVPGTSLAEEMMKIRPGLPFVLISGAVSHEEQLGALAAGVGAFVPKPFNRSTLAAAVRSQLDKGKGATP